jgi:hypothetical protein
MLHCKLLFRPRSAERNKKCPAQAPGIPVTKE